jgi:Ser/Thr protein kinase RdoA (MazF antagonist)
MRIFNALGRLRPYAASLDQDRWDEDHARVLACLWPDGRFVESHPPLFLPQPVLLTPVHGDMHAGNVLMELNHWLPFLIDFANFQPHGLAVQDFAQMEASIKYNLMGREEQGAPEGKDLNCGELARWCTAEEDLVAWKPLQYLQGRSSRRNHPAKRAYRLCHLIRERARIIHNSLLTSGKTALAFEHSYNVALLYHTLRAIGSESPTDVKRILAVFSAGRLVEQFET